jgi:hypothetical protein
MGCDGVDWTDLAQVNDKSLAVVNKETQFMGFIQCGDL